MLRALAITLLVANVGYLSWTYGWLYQVGVLPSPLPRTEPERMAQQLRAERIDIIRKPKPTVTPGGARADAEPGASATAADPVTDAPLPQPASPGVEAALAAAPASTRCLELSGTLTDKQFAALRAAMNGALPDKAWAIGTTVQPPRWIVYSGKFSGSEMLAARKAELKRLQVDFRDVSVTTLQPGLAMGTYSSEASAQQALRDVTKAGVKGAKVVIERPEVTLYTLKLPDATDAVATRFKQLMNGLPADTLKGKTLQPCT